MLLRKNSIGRSFPLSGKNYMDKCDKCGGEACIYITNVGCFCKNCANEMTLDYLGMKSLSGIEKIPEKSRIIVVIDTDNVTHLFRSDYLLFGSTIKWTAAEQKIKGHKIQTHYEFEIVSDVDEDQSEAFQRLKEKVVKGVSEKSLTLSKKEPYFSNALHRGRKQYTLKDHGQFRIFSDKDGNNAFIIDGMEVSPAEFANMLSAFEGFTLYYDIKDNDE